MNSHGALEKGSLSDYQLVYSEQLAFLHTCSTYSAVAFIMALVVYGLYQNDKGRYIGIRAEFGL
jgi:hypothetical protein